MTPLEAVIRRRIAAEGPMTLEDYMALCLGHPEHGYYITRDPLGKEGDFTTSPEISQVFGELIGVFLAAAWQQQGGGAFRLIELGPGRGTLMRDLLRATRHVPEFHASATLHLVETSPVLRAAQSRMLRASPLPPRWHDRLEEIADDLPHFVIANEFFDALPIAQYTAAAQRHVSVAEGRLAFEDVPCPNPSMPPYSFQPMGLWERCLAGEAVMAALSSRIASTGGAALIVDYGYTQGTKGDSFQALRHHAPCSPLERPGEADLTAHVDFLALKTVAERHGCHAAWLSQGEFLKRMGIDARQAALLQVANAAQASEIATGIARLTEPSRMGALFQALAIAQAGKAMPYPFESGNR